MSNFVDWIDKNDRKIWLFIGAVLISVVENKPLLASAVWFIGLAFVPKEG